jgi:hypothetical protein
MVLMRGLHFPWRMTKKVYGPVHILANGNVMVALLGRFLIPSAIGHVHSARWTASLAVFAFEIMI